MNHKALPPNLQFSLLSFWSPSLSVSGRIAVKQKLIRLINKWNGFE